MYAGDEGVFAIESGELLDGKLPRRQARLVQAWIEIHRDALMADWSLAVKGQPVFPIDPLSERPTTMNPRVTAVTPLENHALLVSFGNGEQRRMDVGPYLAYGVFDRLRDPGFFALVQSDHGTLSWPGGIDLDPDSVYLESVPVGQAAAV